MGATREETLDFPTRAPMVATASRQVPAPPDAVFDVLADAAGWSAWFPGLTRASWTSPEPHGVGSTRRVEVGPVAVDERFLAWDRGERFGFTFTHVSAPIARAGVEVIELDGDEVPAGATLVTYTMALEPPRIPVGLAARGAPAVRGNLRRALEGLAKRLGER